ncbi:MAG: cell surface protein SprA [Flavobacteriia bacterium]|nr:MAG: cell surface protein SprA [Flavobacteriia bacterium]
MSFLTTGVMAQVDQDSIPPLPYPFENGQDGSLYLSDYDNYEVVYDAVNDRYLVVSKIGDFQVSYPIVMTQEEYAKYRMQKEMHDYYKGKVNALKGQRNNRGEEQKDLLPKYYVKSNLFESIFGGNAIELDMQGNIEVRMGLLYQKVDNPQLNETNRATTIFDFDQNIGASITAKVGERLKVAANYDTQSTFDFQNIVKLEFDPNAKFDDDGIIKKVEIGNVSMPMRNSLIKGAQNLFGFRTELQFGRTTISTALAKQQSQSKSVIAQGGAIIEEFELKASDYEANKHFFLSQYFKDNFDESLANLPLVSSNVQITNIEVWVTNTKNETENVRNIVALADLGESIQSNLGNPNIGGLTPLPNFIPYNDANAISDIMVAGGPVRNISTVPNAFTSFGTMSQGRDYSVLENARPLMENVDFFINRQLGYISLTRSLNDSEVLAVAYEYTVNGSSTVYKVGELSSDGIIAPDNLVVKLLRSELVITDIPMWDLMMKNIYNLNAFQLQQEGFRLELLYANDDTGVPLNTLQNAETPGVAEETLLNLFYIDRLDYNQNLLEGGDGYFDFVSGVTVFPDKGMIMFPKVEPFGEYIDNILTAPNDDIYIFNELYEYTQTEVKNTYQNKDKYEIKGYFKSDGSQGIALGAFNIPPGSVTVSSGGRVLVEGVDYVVNYQIGRVKIINPSLESSNAPIEVSLEQNAIFSQQRRSFFGIDVEHKFSDHLVAGVSYLRLSEQPFTNKVYYGQEPIQNNIFGFNAGYNNSAPFLTKLANSITFGQTDAESNFSVKGDVAYLLPGTPKAIDINGSAASYIDDFEGSQMPIDLKNQQQWYLASTPQLQPEYDLGGDAVNSLDYGKKRALLAWYNIDNDMHGGRNQPSNIDNDEVSRAEVRRVSVGELFPNDELDLTESTILRTLDLAFYPSQRGTYNFETNNLNDDGTFTDPENRWGGVTRPMTITDFDNSNIEYIQFWLMDPYENYSIKPEEGLPANTDPLNENNQGYLFLNLGNVSEDVLKDNRKMYENGLPEDGGTAQTAPSIWGKVPTDQSLLYAFDDNDDHRLNQDIGFDGLNDAQEQAHYANFLNALPANISAQLQQDPSSDNFMFYKSTEYDNMNAGILTRYKRYNLTQGNTPTANMSPENYITSGTQYPDAEDINKDQTMSTAESYFQYKISLKRSDLVVGQNYIVDKRTTTQTMPNGSTQETIWYQFKVPVTEGEAIGGISNFHSIRFMRMFMTRFRMPVVLRFAKMEMVRGAWRRYKYELADGTVPLTDLNNFESGVVNIEENDGRQPIPYVLPPGIERERLQGTTTVQLQNEQSLSLKVRDMMPETGRSLFKNVSFDMRMFKKLQMFIHAESKIGETEVQDNELVAVIRIGSDLSENYYQIEQPLTITPPNTSDRRQVWPLANELNVDLETLKKLKLERFEAGQPANVLYPLPVTGEDVAYRLRVKGNPNLGKISTIMLGVINKATGNRSAELWFNELRVSEFDNDGGWAAVVSADANLADFMDLAVTGRMSTIGYGNVDQSVNERSQEDTKQYDAVASINAGKLLPEKAHMQIPVNVSISEEIHDPKYDAQYQDILLSETNEQNSPYRDASRDYTRRTSVSVINLKKTRNPNSKKKERFYDIENFAASYAYNQINHHNYNTAKYLDQNVQASLGYNYSFKPWEWAPFKESKKLKNKYFRIIKDFNFSPIPTNLSVNSNINRTFNAQQARTLVEGLPELPELKQRNFMFDWDYTIGFKPTKSIKLSLRALNNYVYDDYTANDDTGLYTRFFDPGSPLHYHQTLEATYQLPINKIPLFSFVRSNYSYTADFDWQGASKTYADKLGNVIQNANTHNLSVDLDMNKFYKTIGLTKLVKTKGKKKVKGLKKGGKGDKAEEEESDNGGKGMADIGMAKGRDSGKKGDISARKGGKSQRSTKSGNTVGKFFYDLLTAVKSVKMSYSENNGMLLPGYVPQIGFLGRDYYSGGFAPSFGFVFGSQADIRNRALENGWLLVRNAGANEEYYSKIFQKTHYDKLNFSASVTPFKNFDIDVRADKIYTKNLSEQMDVVIGSVGETPHFASSVPTEQGNFSMSYIMLGSTFKDADAVFNEFKANRQIIAERLAQENGLPVSGYGTTSQQVILPAFMAAYSGQSADKVKLSAFRNIPLPNWQVTYKGFMKSKWFRKTFSNFTITHGYRSSYSILNFSNNLQYDAANPEMPDVSGNYFSPELYTNVGLIEEFAPLVGVNIKLKNSFSVSATVNKDRFMTLNFNNNTMTQDFGTEYVLGLGYRVKDVPFNMKLQGKKMRFKGDLNLKLDVSLRNDLMMVRYFGEDETFENNQITGGQKMFNLRFIADYNLTKNLQTGFYYIQDASRYAISTTFPRQSISAGLSFKYTLSN